MAQTTPSASEAEQIQNQMREVRAELRDDVQDLVVSANKMADLGAYVKSYPWLCVGAALAAGFLIIPQRSVVVKPDAEGLIELAKRHKLVVRMNDETQPAKKRRGFFGELVGLAAATLLQVGLKTATNQLSQALAPTDHHHSNGNSRGVTP